MPTYTDLRNGFQLGPWSVLPDRGLLRDGELEKHLEPKMVDVLLLLAANQGQVVSKDKFIESVWDGRAQGDEPLNRCIAVLRKQLGDDSRNPTFIETIPRRGYRLKMPITMPEPEPVDEPADSKTARWPYWLTWAAGAMALVIIYALIRPNGAETPDQVDTDLSMTSVAVFPFQCRGTTEEHWCFGFSEALTSTLMQAEGIKVVKSRTSFPDQSSHTEVASLMGVDGLLSGSVQRMGDEVRISAELIDGRNDTVLLSDTLDGSVQDIFRLQEQIATIIRQKISGDGGGSLHAATEPNSFEAFELYSRGQYQFEIRDQASIEEAIDLFQQTIALDPMFGPAYLRLAYAYLLLPEYDLSVSAESMYELAAATTNAGIEADPSIEKLAGVVFGFIYHKQGKWLQSAESYEMALSVETVDPISHHWYSRLLASVGRLDESLNQARLAYEADPDSAVLISHLAMAYFWINDMEQAGRYFGVVSKMTLEVPIHDLAAAVHLIRQGKIADAAIVTKSGLEKNQLNSEWVDPVYAGLEDPELWQQSHEIVSRIDEQNVLPPYILMTLWALLGDADRAIESALANENIGQGFDEVLFLDELKIVREHEKFPLLLEKNGLIDYWNAAGCVWVDDTVQCG